jgi:hypothetical protein
MPRYSDTVRDQNGAPVVGALVSVLTQSGTTAELFDDDDLPLDNPLTTDTYGSFYFNTAVGFYDLVFTYGGRTVTKEYNVAVGEALVGEAFSPNTYQFGATGTGAPGTDDTEAIEALIAYAVENGLPEIYFLGYLVVTRTIYVPVGISIVGTAGERTKVIPRGSEADFDQGFMFICNSTDGEHWTTPYPFWPGRFENIYFANDGGLDPIRGVLAFGPYKFIDCRQYDMTQTFRRPPEPAVPTSPKAEYIDHFTVTRLQSFNDNPSAEYQIDIRGAGDEAIVEQCQFDFNQLAVRLIDGGNAVATIRNCVGGSYLAQDAYGITFEDMHCEEGYFIIDRTDAIFRRGAFYAATDATAPIIQCIDSAGNGLTTFQVTLDGCLFLRQYQFHTAFPYHVSVSTLCCLSVRNSWEYTVNGGSAAYKGIKACTSPSGATPVTAWNEYSHLLSNNGTIYPRYNVPLNYTINVTQADWDGLYDVAAEVIPGTNNTWKAGNGTFYYRALLLIDPVTMIGQANAGFGTPEQSVTMSGTASIVGLLFDGSASAICRQGVVRVYRGTSTGSYDKYADIPFGWVPTKIYDDGDAICEIPWVTQAAAAIPTVYSPIDSSVWKLNRRAILQNVVPRMQRPGNANQSMRVGSAMQVIYDAEITADRTVTLPLLVRSGDMVEVIRTSTGIGAFNVIVSNGSTLATLTAASQSVRLVANSGVWQSLA